MLSLADIGEALTGKQPQSESADTVQFSSVVIDSRRATPKSLFVALPGEHRDGHDYVSLAFAQGASGALVEAKIRGNLPNATIWEPGASSNEKGITPGKPVCVVVPNTLEALQRIAAWWRRRHLDCQVIGITGSVGKTTTKELVASVISQRFRTLKSPGNYNNEIGLPLTVLQMDKSYKRAVLEMSMYDLGEISLLAKIALPRVGVVTNVRPIHLERLGSMERIAQAKAELVEMLPTGGAAVLNGDDLYVREMQAHTRAERVLYYGLRPDNELWADGIKTRGLQGISLRFHWHGHTIPLDSPVLGAHSVWMALAAAGTGLVESMTWDEVIAGLSKPDKPLRMTVVPGMRETTLLDDTYNAGPSSSIAALEFLGTLPGRTVAVLGDMLELGEHEEEGHRQVGQKAAQAVKLLIVVGHRARLIAEEAMANGMATGDVHVAKDNQEALDILREYLEPGDFILIKGSRGMAMEEIVTAIRKETA